MPRNGSSDISRKPRGRLKRQPEIPSSSEDSKINSDELAKQRTLLADERTRLAEERTSMANERTFSAWLRTGLAAVVAGLAIARFIDFGTGGWIAVAVGLILILTGSSSYYIAYWRYRRVRTKLGEQQEEGLPPLWLIKLIITALLISSALAIILLFY